MHEKRDSNEDEEGGVDRLRIAKHSTYMKDLVLTNLHKEFWHMDLRRMQVDEALAHVKRKKLEKEMNKLQTVSKTFERETRQMMKEKERYEHMLQVLALEV